MGFVLTSSVKYVEIVKRILNFLSRYFGTDVISEDFDLEPFYRNIQNFFYLQMLNDVMTQLGTFNFTKTCSKN